MALIVGKAIISIVLLHLVIFHAYHCQGTISIVVSPTNFLQQDMMASMQRKNISAIAINSDTLTAVALASPPRDLWAEAKTGYNKCLLDILPIQSHSETINTLKDTSGEHWGSRLQENLSSVIRQEIQVNQSINDHWSKLVGPGNLYHNLPGRTMFGTSKDIKTIKI
ncbi:hypothetical protein DFH07DRAFT_777741 [Mycena maculata]|uniref:Uncharacterized protein n=1 Tax=Mycena maculata TaxID=230809 RepID=A0AAD7N1M7_9AGAR|nr:hypothetical protein DFH07DRAFT_777741 [Mycena maculata]